MDKVPLVIIHLDAPRLLNFIFCYERKGFLTIRQLKASFFLFASSYLKLNPSYFPCHPSLSLPLSHTHTNTNTHTRTHTHTHTQSIVIFKHFVDDIRTSDLLVERFIIPDKLHVLLRKLTGAPHNSTKRN